MCTLYTHSLASDSPGGSPRRCVHCTLHTFESDSPEGSPDRCVHFTHIPWHQIVLGVVQGDVYTVHFIPLHQIVLREVQGDVYTVHFLPWHQIVLRVVQGDCQQGFLLCKALAHLSRQNVHLIFLILM